MIKLVKAEIKKRKVLIGLQEGNDFFYLTIHARRFRKPIIIPSEASRIILPTIYDERGNPITPIRSKRDSKIKHSFQRPTNFTAEETKDILENKQQRHFLILLFYFYYNDTSYSERRFY